jgi:bilin biosynthesis protein
MRKPAIGPLIDALRDVEPDVRCNAARILGQTGDARAVRPLIDTLRDDNR